MKTKQKAGNQLKRLSAGCRRLSGASEVTHVFFTQTHRGLVIDNAAANVNVLRDRRVLSVGSSFTMQLNEVGRRSAVVPPMGALHKFGRIKMVQQPLPPPPGGREIL